MSENQVKNDFDNYTVFCAFIAISSAMIAFLVAHTATDRENEAIAMFALGAVFAVAYLCYFYVHILLLRVLYVLGNTTRFIIFASLCILYLIPMVGWAYSWVSPFVIYGFLKVTDARKVQEILNLEDTADFYDFKKLKTALLNQAKQSS